MTLVTPEGLVHKGDWAMRLILPQYLKEVCKMDKTAVLVIDVQNVYLRGQRWECVSIDRAQSNIQRICADGRQGRIVFTRYIPFDEPEGVWKDYNRINAEVNSNAWLNELTDEMKAAAKGCGASIIDKPWYSAWKSEAVRNCLADADTVVVTGVVADCCVLSTVFDLIDAGKYVIYLKDAVSGVSKETEDATVTVLKGLAYVHLKIMTTFEYLELSAFSSSQDLARPSQSRRCASSAKSPAGGSA